jgi:hypothetical protein
VPGVLTVFTPAVPGVLTVFTPAVPGVLTVFTPAVTVPFSRRTLQLVRSNRDGSFLILLNRPMQANFLLSPSK